MLSESVGSKQDFTFLGICSIDEMRKESQNDEEGIKGVGKSIIASGASFCLKKNLFNKILFSTLIVFGVYLYYKRRFVGVSFLGTPSAF